jgi:hypothetical protein
MGGHTLKEVEYGSPKKQKNHACNRDKSFW